MMKSKIIKFDSAEEFKIPECCFITESVSLQE